MVDTIKTRVFPEHNYKGIFFNGKTIRIALDDTKPIEELSYPEFYDVKITSKCEGACPYCYMDSTADSEHVEDAVGRIYSFFEPMSVNQRPFQVAIGGGEPTMHPHFVDILEVFDSLGIMPNYTTNGMFISAKDGINKILNATAYYCGGVAVSCHPHLQSYWGLAAKILLESNTKVNFHLIISDKRSCDEFRLIYELWSDKIDYFVLLPYGAQGRGGHKDVDWDYLVQVMPDDVSKIAFGANFYPYLKADPSLYKVSLYEPESMSKFLDLADMKVYPSSFNLEPV